MGISNSKTELEIDYEIENLNKSLKSLTFEVKNFLESEGKEEKFKPIKSLIEKDLKEIENFINSNFDISLALLSGNPKVEDLLNTLIAEKSEMDPTKFNIIKNQNKKIFPYEEKIMNFISQYSNENSCYNSIYQGNPKNLSSGGKKIIFSNNLNDLNLLSDEIIIAIPPIFSNVKIQTIKSQISKYSSNFTKEEKLFFESEDFESFLSDSNNKQISENAVDFIMKFVLMLQNNNTIIYVLSQSQDKEIEFFNFIVKNEFIKSILKTKKMIIIYPKKFEAFYISRKKLLDDLVAQITKNIFHIDFDKCYNDKVNFLGKLILKNDKKAEYIPNRLREKIRKIHIREIDLQYDFLEEEYDKITKEYEEKIMILKEKEKVEKEKDRNSKIKDKKTIANLHDIKIEIKKLEENFKIILSYTDLVERDLVDILNKMISKNKNKFVSRYHFHEIYIDYLDTDFTTRSKIDEFEKFLYATIKSDLLERINITKSQIIFKCFLLRNFVKENFISYYNSLNEKRNVIIQTIDDLNECIEKSIDAFVETYRKDLSEYLGTLDVSDIGEENDNNSENKKSDYLDIFRPKGFCKEYRALKLVEKNFLDFELKNVDSIRILSNFIHLNSSISIRKIVNEYYDFTKIFNEESQNEGLSDFNSFRKNENSAAMKFDGNFKSLKLGNCDTEIDKVISYKLDSFYLVHMILLNNYGIKNLKVNKPESNYRLLAISSVSLFMFVNLLILPFKKWNRKFKFGAFLFSGFFCFLGSYLSNVMKNMFITNSRNYLKANKFIIGKYLDNRLKENLTLSESIMKYIIKVSNESLELINSLVENN